VQRDRGVRESEIFRLNQKTTKANKSQQINEYLLASKVIKVVELVKTITA
jgi:hypothetical protein